MHRTNSAAPEPAGRSCSGLTEPSLQTRPVLEPSPADTAAFCLRGQPPDAGWHPLSLGCPFPTGGAAALQRHPLLPCSPGPGCEPGHRQEPGCWGGLQPGNGARLGGLKRHFPSIPVWGTQGRFGEHVQGTPGTGAGGELDVSSVPTPGRLPQEPPSLDHPLASTGILRSVSDATSARCGPLKLYRVPTTKPVIFALSRH